MKVTSALGYSTQKNYHSKIDEAIKIFHDKQKLKQYMITKPPLQKILQGILYTEYESKKKTNQTNKKNREDRKYQTTGKQKTSNQK
jgi:hypothetical protein